MVYTEFSAVEKPIIEWLEGLSWKYVSPEELKRDAEDPFDLTTIRDAIQRLNPQLEDEGVDKVVGQLRRPANDIAGNKEFLEWVKGEKSLVLKP